MKRKKRKEKRKEKKGSESAKVEEKEKEKEEREQKEGWVDGYLSRFSLYGIAVAQVESKLDDMTTGTSFRPVIDDPLALDAAKVTRVIFCSGKVYYDLVQKRAATPAAAGTTALVRIEVRWLPSGRRSTSGDRVNPI
jgi:hypothetical protein